MDPEAHLRAADLHCIREISTYFWSTFNTAGLLSSDIDSDASYDPSSARLSTDPVLNGLAQLAALRLSCDRAFISVIDDKHQFIVAEATRSISLYDAHEHVDGDALCLGARPLELEAGVCAGTIVAFTEQSEGIEPFLSNNNIYADSSRYIINDFSLEDKYRKRPYITGFPCMRYYAEVPIRIPSGEVIGSLAVVNNKPGSGLDDSGHRTMTEIAKTIMGYLQMVKTKEDHKRAATLLWGFDTLVQTRETRRASNSGPTDTAAPVGARKQERAPTAPADSTIGSIPSSASPSDDEDEPHSFKEIAQPPMNGPTDTSQASAPMQNTSVSLTPSTDPVTQDQQRTQHDQVRSARSSRRSIQCPPRDPDLPEQTDIQTTLSKASQILCKALDLKSVVFLDTRFSTPTKNDGSFASDDRAADLKQTGSQSDPDSHRLSRCLAHSVKTYGSDGPDLDDTVSPKLSKVLLDAMLHHYPTGTIFDFDVEDEDRNVQHSPTMESPGRILTKSETRLAISRAVPAIRHAVFLPLWSPSKGAWLAGGLGWTVRGQRVLDRHDLTYFSAYGATLMADIERLELVATDRAKSIFISTISHELRSPLHGILGTAELLRETNQDSGQLQMIDVIENCGQTLLDTVEHILDYAKINAGTGRTGNHRTATASAQRKSSQDRRAELTCAFHLDVVLEKSVESMVTGHHYRQGTMRSLSISNRDLFVQNAHSRTSDPAAQQHDVTVVLDIKQPGTWTVESELTAWQRIIQNLVGNALKYTHKGFVAVSLQASDQGGEEGRRAALTVRDTGQGMSSDFLQNHLFTPFAQEDGMAVGTGLGLSIVQSIVRDIGGTLEVHSQAGIGTEITVLVPLDSNPSTGQDVEMQPGPEVRKLCLLAFDAPTATPSKECGPSSELDRMTLEAFVNGAKACKGLQIVSSAGPDGIAADVIAVKHEDLALFDAGEGAKLKIPRGTSLLVVSRGRSGVHHAGMAPTDRILYLTEPYGPRKVAEAIEAALRADRSAEVLIRKTDFIADRSKRESPMEDDGSPRSTKRRPKSPTESVNRSSGQGDTMSFAQPPTRLLLVDDNEINLRMLVVFAKKLSCTYATALNGQEAIDRYREASEAGRAFDYFLMDISMPVLDGLAAARAIRELERTGHLARVPIVALTGAGSADARQQAQESGVDLFWMKPVPLKKIRELLSQRLEISPS